MPPNLSLCDHAGWAWVKRKTLAKRHQYYLRLTGGVLSAHAAPRAPVDWDESIVRAVVAAPTRRSLVIITLPGGASLYLSLPNRAAAQQWAAHLQDAARRAFDDLYTLGEKIGEGAFASVFRATHRASGRVFAVKRIRKKQFDMQMARELEREMYAMKATRHVGVVRTHDVFNAQDMVLLVLDLMKGGTLKDNVQDAGGRLAEHHSVDIVRQVLHALHYLHAKGIVHRDIKLENILCEDRAIPVRNIRVADFGYVNFVTDHTDFCLRSLVGTPVYVAPEVVNRSAYGCPVDMYAVGVMLYRMLSGSYPFDAGDDDEKTMALAVEGNVTFEEPPWAATSIMCKNFVRALLQPRPERRLTAKAALLHPWIEGATMSDLDQVASSPVTPYSDPPSVVKNLASALEEETDLFDRAHGFGSLVSHTKHTNSHRVSAVHATPAADDASIARTRWKKGIFACVFIAVLRAESGLRPLRPQRNVQRRTGRPDVVVVNDDAPPSLRRRLFSAFSHNGGRAPGSYHGGNTNLASPSLGDRIRRTLSFSRV